MIDWFGVLEPLYTDADVVIVGGSFVRKGGHNLLEPAARGGAVVIGPHAWNFESTVEELLDMDAIRVANALTLVQTIEDISSMTRICGVRLAAEPPARWRCSVERRVEPSTRSTGECRERMEPRGSHTMDDDLLIDGTDHTGTTIVLAHGAGAPMDTPFMNTIAQGLAGHGHRVVRFEFDYMRARREGRRPGPDRPALLERRWRDVIDRLGGESSLVIGGKSLGGRIASMVADAAGVRGLVCLGYPFHPPGKPERLRVAHLAKLETPALIVQGTRDPFGGPDDVASYELSSQIRVVWMADGDHSLSPRASSGRTKEQNLTEAIDSIAAFVVHTDQLVNTRV